MNAVVVVMVDGRNRRHRRRQEWWLVWVIWVVWVRDLYDRVVGQKERKKKRVWVTL